MNNFTLVGNAVNMKKNYAMNMKLIKNHKTKM